MASDINGKAWIKDSKLFVQDPGEGGGSAEVTPCEGIQLIINGALVEETTTVSKADKIEIKIEPVVSQPGNYKIFMPAGGLSAALSLETGRVRNYSLQDSEPTDKLIMKATFEESIVCPFTLQEFNEELRNRNITFGLKQEIINSLIEKPQEGDYVFAEGYPPGETTDDVVKLITERKSESQADLRNEKIDFREMVEILSVEEGEELATRLPGKQGEDGMKVTGESIPAAKPTVFELVAGSGAEALNEGLLIKATNSGSPVIKRTGNKYHITVQPVLTHKGDVDLASGNIKFKGDVKVLGAVREGMSVMATGRVEINGMVFESKINAMKGVNIKQNITGSSLLAGGNNALVANYFSIIDPIHDDLAEITQLLPGLTQNPKLQNVKLGQLVQVLIDKKYPRLPNLINELFKLADSNTFGLTPEMSDLVKYIAMNIRGLNILKLESVDQLNRIVNGIELSHTTLDKDASKSADVVFPYAVNSNIEASGNVKVTGRGCINTTIRASGSVTVSGVFRGGDIFAGGDVTISEAGSELGARTLIRTGERQKVLLRKVFEGVRIQIGDRQATISNAQSNVRAELSKDGNNILVGANAR